MAATESEHTILRDAVRRFVASELEPHQEAWEHNGQIARQAWLAAGENGFLCCDLAPDLGGPGGDFRHSAIVIDELARAGTSGACFGFMLHSDIVAPYIVADGTPEQKSRWLPLMASGRSISAIAMSEPDTGSDLKAVRTTAQRVGDQYVINGQKTFISHGLTADCVIIVAKTRPDLGAKGISLFLVDCSTPGFKRGRALQKLGLKAQDTAELYFEDMRVPADCLLGPAEGGFGLLMRHLPRERLVIAIAAVASAEGVLARTIDYVRERKAFGKTVFDFQNSRFKLAEAKAEITLARIFVDHCIELQAEGALSADLAAIAKLQCTEMLGRVVDSCLQLHGGYGYIWEYPIARSYADARVLRIFGGTNEIMKELIARTL